MEKRMRKYKIFVATYSSFGVTMDSAYWWRAVTWNNVLYFLKHIRLRRDVEIGARDALAQATYVVDKIP